MSKRVVVRDSYVSVVTEIDNSGHIAAIGQQGPPGKSAYELAVKNGYQGSVEDWLNEQGVADIAQFQQDVSNLQDRAGDIEQAASTLEGRVGDNEQSLDTKVDKGSVYVSTNVTIEPNTRYIVEGDITLTLPPSADVGDTISISKTSDVQTINGPVIYGQVSDNTLEYDLYEALYMVFDGTNWRIE